MLDIDWKTRALKRGAENKKMTKRIKELNISRDNWKNKAIARQEELDALKKQMETIKKNIQKITGS